MHHLRVLRDQEDSPGHGVPTGLIASPKEDGNLCMQQVIRQRLSSLGVPQPHELGSQCLVTFSWGASSHDLQQQEQQLLKDLASAGAAEEQLVSLMKQIKKRLSHTVAVL